MHKTLALLLAVTVVGCAMGDEVDETSLHEAHETTLREGHETTHQLKTLKALIRLRAKTAKYHHLDNALDAGFELGNSSDDFPEPVVTGCVAHPTLGAMGYHYFDVAEYEDPRIDPLHPEVLIYATDEDGDRELVAVEWVVKKETWEAAGNTAPPELFGHTLHILNPALNWYLLHAWIWKRNPSGVFSDWNPNVTCP